MNLKKCDAAAIAALVVLMAGSHIFADHEAFAISSVSNIINSHRCWTMCTRKWRIYVLGLRKIRPLATEQWGCIEESAAKR